MASYSLAVPPISIDPDRARSVFLSERYEDDSGTWFDEHTVWSPARTDLADLVGDVLILTSRHRLYGPDLHLSWALAGDADGIEDLLLGYTIPGTALSVMLAPLPLRQTFTEHAEKTGADLAVGVYTTLGEHLAQGLAALR